MPRMRNVHRDNGAAQCVSDCLETSSLENVTKERARGERHGY
jgi:BarA-like signal transduction histidine kinase